MISERNYNLVLGAGLEKTRKKREYFSSSCATISQNCGIKNGSARKNKPSEMRALTLYHDRRAGIAVRFHDKVDSLFYSSHILGFLVKEELVLTFLFLPQSLKTFLSKLKIIWCLPH